LPHASRLNLIPACQPFSSLKKVSEADYNAKMAMNKGDAALGNIKTFDGTCSSTATDSSYNSDTQINKLVADSKMATQTAVSAVNALAAAIKFVTPVGNSLAAISAPKDCVNEAKALPAKLSTQKKNVEGAMKKLQSCVSRNSVSTSTHVSTGTDSGISGFKPDCKLVGNPQPGKNCQEAESSCPPDEPNCEDRSLSFQ
jgi:hypothetical protein